MAPKRSRDAFDDRRRAAPNLARRGSFRRLQLEGRVMRNGLIRGWAALLGVGLFAFAHAACSDEIKVIASAAVKETYLELVPQFEKATGHKVVTIWSGTADMMKRLQGGETVDLVIIGSNSLDELVKLGKIVPGSRVDFVKSGVGVAVRAGARKPDISSGDAVKQALLSASSIGYSSGPSGVYLDGLFQRMGIADQLKPKLKRPPSGASVGEMLSRGEAEIGFQQVSELIHVSGIDYLGPLPPDVQQITVFSSGIHAGAAKPDAAKALASFLSSPAAAPVIKKNGMEPG
jgi:molybdate transport system substrate-binding protein